MTDPRYIYRPMLDLIGQTEGTARADAYNETLAYGKLVDGVVTKGPGKDVSLVTMTLDQVDALQTFMLADPDNEWNSSAVGLYQIVRTTLRDIRATLGLKGNELFDAAMQDRLGCFLLGKRGIDIWLEGAMSEDDLINSLAREWASLPTTRDAGFYAGQNAAVKSARVREALAEVRKRHQQGTATPDVPETLPGPIWGETLTLETLTALAGRDTDQLEAAGIAIALAIARQRGWRIEPPGDAPPRAPPRIVFQPDQPKESDMDGIKSWFQSKGVMGGVTALATLIGPVFGLDLGSTNINDATVAINELVAAAGAIVAIWGRITAKSRIAGGVTGKG